MWRIRNAQFVSEILKHKFDQSTLSHHEIDGSGVRSVRAVLDSNQFKYAQTSRYGFCMSPCACWMREDPVSSQILRERVPALNASEVNSQKCQVGHTRQS